MAAKRVSVIIAELAAYIQAHGSAPSEWRFEILGATEALSRLGAAGSQPGKRLVCEAYSARDAHDVECTLKAMGCVSSGTNDDPTRTFIWLEIPNLPTAVVLTPPAIVAPVDR